MPDEVRTLLRCEERDRHAHQFDDLIETARAGGAQERLQLREGEFDGVEIGTVGRKEPKPSPSAFDRGLYLHLLVDRKIVEDHDLARPECGHEDLLDIREECRIVDRAVEHRWRGDPLQLERSDDRVRLPVRTRRVIAQANAPRTSTIATE